MEAAEKIPKKLYVYLDTTRGLHHRHGVKDVRRRGAGHRVRHARKRRVRRYPDADGIGKSAAGPRFSKGAWSLAGPSSGIMPVVLNIVPPLRHRYGSRCTTAVVPITDPVREGVGRTAVRL